MAKYAFLGGYTTETWARFVQNPGDRAALVRKAAESVGGKLDVLYWTFGEDDFLAIFDAPDDLTMAAISVGAGTSGSLRNVRTIKLITADELQKVLAKAKTVAGAYVPPGAREPVGARG
ncbi:MAG TPA: GYD domain-containing protein [Candidatus Eisenbacteria bacterium]|jgi:uncharacterized protein with GYD domain|nr:GYD domain-containing protein [Candidatus Eisenbacteria bacterium]